MSFFESESQKHALRELPKYCQRCVTRTTTASEDTLWHSNVISILGERGAGKSTTLHQLQQAMSSEWLVLPPLDCSQLPQDIPPGTAVLLHIARCLQESPQLLNKIMRDKLDKLIKLYSRSNIRFSDLCLDLSNSVEEFGEYIVKGIKDRLDLKTELKSWLTEAYNHPDFKKNILFLLDDFDLIHKQDTRSWLRALLDELHQAKLIFVITADFYRLQHLSWGDDDKIDERTGRAMINKLIPPENRLWLTPWPLSELNRYPSAGKPLKKLLSDYGTKLDLPYPLLYQLVPKLPRGWQGLYNRLEEWLNPEDEPSHRIEPEDDSSGSMPKNEPSAKPNERAVIQLLTLMANCREESLLARKLQAHRIFSWIEDFHMKNEELSQIAWDDLVACARCRANPEFREIPSLPGLFLAEPIETARPLTPMNHPPDWDSPLRNDLIHFRILRDASPQSESFWAELLVELGLNLKLVEAKRAIRNRLKFIKKWTVLKSRFDLAGVEVRYEQARLLEYFESAANPPRKATLLWFEHKQDGPGLVILKFGWQTLISRLQGRDPYHQKLRESLYQGTGGLTGNPVTFTDPALWNFIPDQVWAIIHLADALSRCPWQMIAAYRNLQLPVYIGITVAFIRSAYVDALISISPETKFSDFQHGFLQVFQSQDASILMQNGERGLLTKINLLFEDGLLDLREQLPDNSLTRALICFLDSPLYTEVVENLKMTEQVAEMMEMLTQEEPA